GRAGPGAAAARAARAADGAWRADGPGDARPRRGAGPGRRGRGAARGARRAERPGRRGVRAASEGGGGPGGRAGGGRGGGGGGAGRRGLVAVAGDAGAGDAYVSIRAEDVILEKGDTAASSARNRLAGTVTALVREGPMVRVTVDCGFPLTALVTSQACGELG